MAALKIQIKRHTYKSETIRYIFAISNWLNNPIQNNTLNLCFVGKLQTKM